MEWFSQLFVAPAPPSLQGDKIILPPSALEQLLANAPSAKPNPAPLHSSNSYDAYNPYSVAAQRHAQAQFEARDRKLPNPLTFKLVNPSSGRVVYAGIREFSGEEGQIALSPFLLRALHVEEPSFLDSNEDALDTSDGGGSSENYNKRRTKLSVHFEQLSKGTFVKLRPLEAGYDPDDWKALLESHLRSNFTTLTKGEVLDVRTGGSELFQFLVDEFRPEGSGICVVDTDLEVDIEALNEEQARETLKRVAAKRRMILGTAQGSSIGGALKLMKPENGQVLSGEYVDYELSSWPRTESIEIFLGMEEANVSRQVDLLVNPMSTRLTANPREDEHVFANFQDQLSKSLILSPSSTDVENAESLHISVHAAPLAGDADPIRFTIGASVLNVPVNFKQQQTSQSASGPDEVICQNCKHVIPKQSIVLHENFCRRNNVQCPYSNTCDRVFQRDSPALQEHWHCDQDSCDFSGSSPSTYQHHIHIFHTRKTCPSCPYPDAFPSLPILAQHRVTVCPSKQILCKFCHLIVPQEGSGADPFATPDAEVVLSGLTAHEVADGGRTTECHLCGRIIRLREMATHLKNHDFERFSRPVPRVCRNILCGRTLDGANVNGDTRSASRVGQGPGNEVGLCNSCFAPLYVSMHDPEGKALKRRVERRYLSQLTSGCGKKWCRNPMCKNGRMLLVTEGSQTNAEFAKPLTISEAAPLAKPYTEGIKRDEAGSTPLHFCTDEASQRRRTLASMLAAEEQNVPGGKQYNYSWCVAALEAHKGDTTKAHEWLKNFAPNSGEETQILTQ